MAIDFQCGYIDEPDLDMYKFTSVDRNPANYGGYEDPVLDKLYDKQSQATDPEERKEIVREFEKRLLDEQAYQPDDAAVAPHHPALARLHGLADVAEPQPGQHARTVWLSP